MKRTHLVLAVLSLSALMPSCGGGGSKSDSARTGQLSLKVIWPDKPALAKHSQLISVAPVLAGAAWFLRLCRRKPLSAGRGGQPPAERKKQ